MNDPVPDGAGTQDRLADWLAGQVEGAESLRIDGLDRIDTGHSAELHLVTVVWRTAGREERREVVIRLRPPSPGLLEPYDLERQFRILRALEATPVKAPRALGLEPTGDVLGRPFLVMERLSGLTWRDVAGLLKALRFDPELGRELGADPDTLSPRDRERYWFAVIGLARVDSPEALAEAEKLVAPLRELGYVIAPPPSAAPAKGKPAKEKPKAEEKPKADEKSKKKKK